MIELKKASLKDIDLMQTLVKPEIEKGIILPRTDNEIATNIRSYTTAFFDNELVGYAALHIFAKDLAEIRSLVVKDGLRGHGIGKKLIAKLIEEAKFYDIKKVFALTYQQTFFEKSGFKEIPKEQLPEQKIWADCIKCKHFPICNEIAVIYNL